LQESESRIGGKSTFPALVGLGGIERRMPPMASGKRLWMDVETQVQCVLEGLSGPLVSGLCWRYGLSQWQYYRIRDRFLEGGKAGLASNGSEAEREMPRSEVTELERSVGRLTMDKQVLKKTLRWASGLLRKRERKRCPGEREQGCGRYVRRVGSLAAAITIEPGYVFHVTIGQLGCVSTRIA